MLRLGKGGEIGVKMSSAHGRRMREERSKVNRDRNMDVGRGRLGAKQSDNRDGTNSQGQVNQRQR